MGVASLEQVSHVDTVLHAAQDQSLPGATAVLATSGRHILAQVDEEAVVYQAYRPEIGHFAAQHGYFGGRFSLRRMSWIKPNFLWMMFRSGWGTKEGQEVTLPLRARGP